MYLIAAFLAALVLSTPANAEISDSEAASLCKRHMQMTKEDIVGCVNQVQTAESFYGCKPSTDPGKPPLTALFQCMENGNRAAEERVKKAVAAEKAKKALPGVHIGMTAKQVLEESNWGKPKRVNRTTTARGTSEQWVYGDGNYLYFENGVLTAIQN